jgi:hypothetical protein
MRSTFTRANSFAFRWIGCGGKCGRNPCLWDPKHDLSGGESMQAHYGSHSRHPSDGGAVRSGGHHPVTEELACCPPSPLSHSSGMYRVQGHMHMRQAQDDGSILCLVTH